MKRYQLIASALILTVAASCSSTYHSSRPVADDVYYSRSDRAVSDDGPQRATANQQPANYSATETTVDNNQSAPAEKSSGDTYITNNYYNNDDYYDYAYAARLRRFYTPAVGLGYYDPFYTNRYWYDYQPASWGVSIYLGYNWWAPSWCYADPFWYGPSISFYYGYGYGYSPWYNHWYGPGYAYYPYYGSYGWGYWNGYRDGYMHGYYHGLYNGYYHPYYYNSFDASSYYYGPRSSISSTGKSPALPPRSLGEKYQSAVAENVVPDLSAGSVRGKDNYNPSVSPVRNVNDSKTTSPSELPSHPGVKADTREPATQPVRDTKQPVYDTKSENVKDSKPNTQTGRNPNDGKTPVDVRGEMPVQQAPPKGIISTKNESGGGGRQPSKKTEVQPVPEQNQGGPRNEFNYSTPKSNDSRQQNVTPKSGYDPVKPNTGSGGTIRNQPQQNNNWQTPRNENPRMQEQRNIEERKNEPKIFNSPRQNDAPRKDENYNRGSYERSRDYQQPKAEPRQEPRQYKQENTPAPRQQSYPVQERKNQNSDNSHPNKRR